LIVLVNNYFKGQEFDAATALGKIEVQYAQGNYEQVLPDLESIVSNYESTSSGNLATFYLGNAYYFTNDTTNAKKYFKKYSEDGNSELLRPSALAGLAACYEWEKDYLKAAQLFKEAAEDYPDYFEAPSYLINAGRCFLNVDDNEMARNMFEKVIDDYPTSNVVQDAELLLAEM